MRLFCQDKQKKQNNEKLTQTLISLRHCYDDNRQSAEPFATPCEGEIRGYYLLFNLEADFFNAYTHLHRDIQRLPQVGCFLLVYILMKNTSINMT